MEQQLRDQAAEIERLKANELRAELAKTAARQMKDDHNIVATQDMLDFVVGADAKSTNANIQKLVRIILDDRKTQEQKGSCYS